MPSMPQRMQRAASGKNLRHRTPAIRNLTGGTGIAGPRPPVPGQGPPIIQGGQPSKPPTSVPHGPNAQGYNPIHYGQNNQKIGYAKVGQARNQTGGPAPAPAPAGSMSHLAQLLSQGILPDRFNSGFNIAGNGKIVDTTVGVQSGQHNAQYQKLYNAARAAGLNITGGKGEGGTYNPTVLYARGGKHQGDYVDLRTGGINPPSTGGSGEGMAFVNDAVLARLQNKSGFDPSNPMANKTVPWTREVAANVASGVGNSGLNTNTTFGPTSATPGGQASTTSSGAATGGQLPGNEGRLPVGSVATPESAFGAGRDPGKHAAYWADKGWHQNPATGVWHGPNGAKWDQTPNDKSAGGSGAGGAGGAGGAMAGTATAASQAGVSNPGGGAGQGNLASMALDASVQQLAGQLAQLPLDPQFEMQRAQLQVQLQNALAQANASQGRLSAEAELARSRMDTNRDVDTQALLEAMAARGTVNSSINDDNRALLATDYARQGQDLGISIADALAQIAGTTSGAYTDYNQQLIDLLGESAARSNDSYAPVDQGPARNKPTRKKNGRRGRRGKRGKH